jgi:hypothetical protein
MRVLFVIVFIAAAVTSCNNEVQEEFRLDHDWSAREVPLKTQDSLEKGTTYLSIYSQIYSKSQNKTHNLTAMASLRNTSEQDTVFITRAEYFDSKGNAIRNYVVKPIYLAPLETLDIVIVEPDTAGGTGANFIFDWQTTKGSSEPFFEAVMSSTLGQQGLSLTTQGKRIK